MRKTGARLSLAGAMVQQSHLEPIDMAESKTSSLTKLEHENKFLKQENSKLKSGFAEMRSMYNQLIQENSHEKFDERRVTLLKSQIIQLERQLLLFSESLSSRTETLFEVENNLQWLADKCRDLISKEVRGPQVPVERSDLVVMVETAESARIKLYKQIENKSKENLSKPLKFYSEFLSTNKEDVTLLDIASGNLQYINLKHVSKLETKLSTLYKDLIQLHATMETDCKNDLGYLWSSSHVATAARERLATQVLKSCACMKDCCSDLLELSLLYPSAPWPPIRKCALKEITADRILDCIPVKFRHKSGETSLLIQALVKAYNYKVFMLQNQNKSLREEVKYHQKVYNLQLKYTESLFQAIREAYSSFEDSTYELIVKPLNVILDSYIDLSQSASESSLKKFLHVFKDQVCQLTNIVETLDKKEGTESEVTFPFTSYFLANQHSAKVLSQFGEEFFQDLEKLVRVEQSRRDLDASRIEELSCEQERLDKELREILEDQESRMQNKLSQTADNSTDPSAQSDSSRLTESVHVSEQFSLAKDDNISDKSEHNQTRKKGKNKGKDKLIHTREWVNILDDQPVERGMSDLNLEDKEDLSNAELLEFHNKSDTAPVATNRDDTEHRADNSEVFVSEPDKSIPGKKKKLGYVPNTFVPNKTLQLRRSGSLSRLSTQDSKVSENESSKLLAQQVEVRQERIGKSASKKVTKGRPAFR